MRKNNRSARVARTLEQFFDVNKNLVLSNELIKVELPP